MYKMFDKAHILLEKFKKLDNRDPRRVYAIMLADMLSSQSTSQLEETITVLEQTKFHKTYPTFFASNFTLRSLLSEKRPGSQFLNKAFKTHEEISPQPINSHQTETLAHGVLNDEFTEVLMDIHQELIDIHKKLPRTYALSQEQIRKAVDLVNLQDDLNKDHETPEEAALDLGRGIQLQGLNVAENASQKEKIHLLQQFSGDAITAVSAVSQHIYAHLGSACNQFFETKDKRTFVLSCARGTTSWKKQEEKLYAEVLYDIASISEDGQIYRLDPNSKTLIVADDQDLHAFTTAIRTHQPFHTEPIYSCRARLDLVANNQGILRPRLSTLEIQVNAVDLEPIQHSVVYSANNIKQAQQLKVSESAVNSKALILAVEKELEATLRLHGHKIKHLYPLTDIETMNQVKISVYAIQYNKKNYYVLDPIKGFVMKSEEEMAKIASKRFQGLKPLCVAEAHISDSKKFTGFECTFNIAELQSSVNNEPLTVLNTHHNRRPSPG